MVRRRTFGDGESDLKLKERKKVPSISYFTLFTFASKWDKILIFVSTVATFVAGITLPYAITIVAGTFQDMVTYQKSVFANNTNDEEFLRKMHIFGVKYSSIGVILFLGGYLGAALMNVTAINQIFKMRQAYLRAALNQDLAYYDVEKSGHFASRMADDVMKVEEGIGDKVSSLVYNFTVCIGCVTMAIYKGWKLALLCLTTAPITFLLVGITGKIASRISKKVTIASSSASAIAQEAISSVRTVYAFNGQEKALDSYRLPLSEVRKRNIRKDIFTGLSVGFLFFCIFSSYALSFYLGVYLIINDPENYNADVMFSVFFGVLTGMSNLGAVGTLVGSFGGAKGAGAQIFHLLNNKPTINPLLDVGLKPATSEGNIDLKNVIFFYPSRPGVTVLNGVSLEVKHGQSVALVGHSGCGKSTIIQLILRFYDVVSGSVSFDGRNIKDLSVCWLRSRIGLVGQEPVLFSATIKENILYGREDATDEEVETAAKMANAHQFIVRLPKGYNTLVGERGASLSGGQKQRIAIARALIKNPLILLLDEATSALDSSSEAKVQSALEKAAAGRTTIVVAHRLSTIRHVNMIHVMKQGAVIESGSHQELMAKKGQYYEMVKLQEPDIEVTKEKQVERENSATEYEATEKVETETEKDERKQDKMSFWRVVALNRPEWKSITVGSICSTAVGFTMPIFIVAFGDLFGSMSDPDTTKMMEKAKEIAVICILLGLVMGVCNLLESVSFGLAGAYLTERLRVRMFQHMMRQQMSYYDDRNNSTGALCARLSSEAAHVQQATGQRIGILLQGVGSISLGLILAMTHEWRVGAVAMCFLPLLVIVIYYQAKTTKDESRGNLATVENSTKIAVEAVSNIRTVASLGREKRIVSEYMSQLEKNLRISRRSAHCRGVVQGISRSMFNFINAAALTYGGHLIVSDGVAYNDILITTQSLQIASGQAQNAFTYAPDFQKGIIAAERIVAFLRTAPTICDAEVPVVRGYKSQGEATFQTVEFSYPTRKKIKVLQGIDLKVESGKTVALVGHSGCGKSTIIQLLQRFYDPDFGRVFMDSYPIPKLRISELRQSFGLVSQEPVLFDCSIRENIAYGDNSRKVPDEEVFDVARQANIHEFIVSLPEGYNTNIGSKGVQLSGGQKQRVAIARALVRKPMILLLDEATSALDSESEKVVVEALERARSGRTCVIVAHRLSTVRDAHCICVVDGGRVAELGTHEQLLAKNGFYHKLYNTNV